jgi:Uroporphyrinogen decarboxylase (URO-D)
VNERERFRRLFRGEPVDRPPLLEEGIREEVIERWQAQGMPAGKTHLEIFGLTPHENVEPDLRFRPRAFGRVLDLSARGYRRAFDVSAKRLPKDWRATARRLEERDHIVGIWASRGFFQALGVGDWPTLEQVLRGVLDHPRRIRNRLAIYGDFCARMLEMALEDLDPEFIYVSEPISGNDGPLISPAMFEEFMIPVYERIVSVARAHGCEQILVSTYGNTAQLLPCMIRTGVTILWVSEAAEVPEIEYRSLRRRYGTGLGLIGGIPLSILRAETADTMESRLRETVQPLLESGRYLPLAGGRVREEIPWSVYRRYRETLAGMIC